MNRHQLTRAAGSHQTLSRMQPAAPVHVMDSGVEVHSDEDRDRGFSFGEMVQMSEYLAKSRLIKGVETPEQAFGLMLFAQSQGLHPGTVVSRYHLMDGSPSMKSDVMLAEFQADGGRVEWHRSDDEVADASFVHPTYHPKPFRVSFSLAKLVESEIAMAWDRQKNQWVLKANYRKSPAAMLRARVVTAGIRAVHPGVQHGIYAPEELDSLVEANPNPVEATVVSANIVPTAAPASAPTPTPTRGKATPVQPAAPALPVEDVAVRTMPENAKVDTRSYVDLVTHEAQVLTLDIRAHDPEAKEISKFQLYRHLVKAAERDGLFTKPVAPGEEWKPKNAEYVEIGQDLYKHHRVWVRTELAAYVEEIYKPYKADDGAIDVEASPAPAAPAAPRMREMGEDG